LPFNLPEELASYCFNDVNILVHSVVEFKKIFQEKTGVDILLCNTIASACMKAFQLMLNNDQTLALITEKGYGMDKQFKQSDIARKWLRWYAHINEFNVQDCESPEYEKKIGRFRVDGFVSKNQRPVEKQHLDLVLEVHGCFHHACLKHYPDDQQLVIGNRTAGNVRKRNKEREEELNQLSIEMEFELEIIWEW
jgi:hypothetical protein